MRSRLRDVPSTLTLARGELASARLRAGAYRVSCLGGRLWVTGPASREDFVLAAGEHAMVRGGGTLVIEALRPSTALVEADMAAGTATRPALEPLARPAGLFS
jgi:hypothetical protein